VNLLLEMAELRIKASRHGIKSIVASGQDLVFSFDKDADGQAEALLSNTSGKLRIPEPQTAYLRLEKNYFEPRTLISILRKMLNR
jgi:transcription-repair coupling factor (superfamily II helicase)